MTRKNTNQSTMYLDGSDLPLFSGCAQTATIDTFVASEVGGQDSLFAPACGTCLDTGKVDNRPCICQAGDQYRQPHTNEQGQDLSKHVWNMTLENFSTWAQIARSKNGQVH